MPILGREGESLSKRLFGNKGVGQGLKNLATGKTTLSSRVAKGLSSAGGFLGKKIVGESASAYEGEGGNSAINNQNGSTDEETRQLQTGGNYKDIGGSGAYGSNYDNANKKNQIAALTSNWDDTDDSIGDTEKELESFGKGIKSGLTKARDAYLNSSKLKLDKTGEAIKGNRELITKNQTGDLKDLAEDVRKSVFNTNISLGSAAGSSASEAAAKAISRAAAKNRSETLKNYGDQISQQNQNESNAWEEYNTQRSSIYDWEERNRNQLMEEYERERETLKRLKDKVPDWKKEDIENLQDKNLTKLISGMQSIFSMARGYRDTLNQMLTEMYGSADELKNSTIDIDAPAELNTPEFDENLEAVDTGLEDDENSESFYNPNTKNKRRNGTDILGNSYAV